jgi:hypothetical protein
MCGLNTYLCVFPFWKEKVVMLSCQTNLVEEFDLQVFCLASLHGAELFSSDVSVVSFLTDHLILEITFIQHVHIK